MAKVILGNHSSAAWEKQSLVLSSNPSRSPHPLDRREPADDQQLLPPVSEKLLQ